MIDIRLLNYGSSHRAVSTSRERYSHRIARPLPDEHVVIHRYEFHGWLLGPLNGRTSWCACRCCDGRSTSSSAASGVMALSEQLVPAYLEVHAAGRTDVVVPSVERHFLRINVDGHRSAKVQVRIFICQLPYPNIPKSHG